MVCFSGGIGRGTGGLMKNFENFLKENGEKKSEWINEEEYAKDDATGQYRLVEGEKVIPEASVFEKIFRIALKKQGYRQWKEVGVLTESRSENTGANIQNTAKMLQDQGVKTETMVLVTTPVLLKRAVLTVRKQFPYPVTLYSYPSYRIRLDQMEEGELVATITLGLTEIPRIIDYQKKEEEGGPKNGPFVTSVEVPEEEVMEPYRKLKLAVFEISEELKPINATLVGKVSDAAPAEQELDNYEPSQM